MSNQTEVTIRLEGTTLESINEVSALSGVAVPQVIQVVLALFIVKEKAKCTD